MTLRLPETMILPPFTGSFSLFNEGVLLGQVTSLDFIGSQVEATISGIFGYVTVTAGPGGGSGAGIMGWDDGVPIGTGTVLNAGRHLTMTLSGSVLLLDADNVGIDQIGVFIRDDGVARGTGTTLDFRGGITAQFTGGYTYIDVGLTTGMQRTILVGANVGGLVFLATGVGTASATAFNTIPVWGMYGNVTWSYDGPGTPAQGGGSLYLQIPFLSTGSMVLYNEGVILGSALSLDVVGERAVLTLSGTYGQLLISPDPIELIGIYGLDDGVPRGTGTWLDARAGLTMTLSGTVLTLDAIPFSGPFPQPVFGVMGWDEGIPLGTGSVLNFVGAGVSVTLSGTVLNVGISAGGSGFDAFDEGSSLGSATQLDAMGGGVTLTLSGTRATIQSIGTFDRDLPAAAWYPSSDAAGFASARAQVKQSTGSAPSPRYIEWLFHPALNEYLVLEMTVPQNFIGTPRLVVDAKMASGTSGLVEWGARAFVRGPGGTIDADGAVYQAAAVGTGIVPSVAGREFRAQITLTMTGVVAGNRLNLLLYRNATGTPDTGAGDAEFVGADFTYSGY